MMNIPYLVTENQKINEAYRMAVGTLTSNILPFKDGILEEEEPVIIAGLGYDTPWTRDTAINVMNGGGILCPDVAKNTLHSVMGKGEKGYYIDGQYWDAVIWTTGAWQYYLYTGDRELLAEAYEATVNSLEFFEKTEYNQELGLFRGAACYGDGVAAYPDIYASHGFSGILSFPEYCKEHCAENGVGVPMYALSTNCLYYGAYVIADKMAVALGKEKMYEEKAEKLCNVINESFWNEKKGTYNYIIDNFGGSDYQEGLGLAFAILYGVADEDKKAKIFKNTYVTPHGIACVWPTFARYSAFGENEFGRHSGTVWPHVQGFWASAAAQNGQREVFENELLMQTDNAVNSGQFAEIYHPLDGKIYGGWQEENRDGIFLSKPQPWQTWSATAYIRNILLDLVGLQYTEEGLRFAPVCTNVAGNIRLKHLVYRNAVLDITICKSDSKTTSFVLDGTECEAFVPADINDKHKIEIFL